jgi:hypothetical protein
MYSKQKYLNLILTKENLDNLEKNNKWILNYYLNQIDITDDIYDINDINNIYKSNDIYI